MYAASQHVSPFHRPRPVVRTPVTAGVLSPADRVSHGIWPRRLAVWMAGLYVALFILRPWEEMASWLADIHFERLYALCMIGVVLFDGKLRLHAPLQSFAVVLFVTALAVSAACAAKPLLAWEPWYAYLVIIIFYFVLLLTIRTPYELFFIVACYVVTMGLYLAKAQWEFFLNDRHDFKMGVRRMIGLEETHGDPNALGLSIAVSLPLFVFLWNVRKPLAARWPPLWRQALPLGLAAYAFLATTCIILTHSRAAILTSAFFVGVLAFRSKGLGNKLLVTIGGVLLLAGLWLTMSEDSKNRIRSIWDPNAAPANATESAQGRIEGVRAGLQMFRDSPLTGVGMGNFIPYRVAHLDGVSLLAHNLAGQVLGETGLIGAITFLFMILVAARSCRQTRKLAKGRSDPTTNVLAELARACENVIILLFVQGLFLHTMTRFNWIWVAAFSALALHFMSAPAESSRRHPTNGRTRTTTVAFGGART